MYYSDIHKTTIRDRARSFALDVLSLRNEITGTTSAALKANRVQFLYFHHVFQDEEAPFRKLLARLTLTHNFITYSEAVDRALTKKIDKPCLTISFDDGIKNCLAASKIMDDYGAKGCFFVCPEILAERDATKLANFSKRLEMPPLDYLNWEDVAHLLKMGHEVGGHTMSHINLAEASSQQLQDEIGGSYETLKEQNGAVPHFAWPFGRFSHFSASAAKEVFKAGYKSCASAERGCHVAGVDAPRKLCIRRDSIIATWPEKHINYFMAKNLERSGIGSETWPAGWAV